MVAGSNSVLTTTASSSTATASPTPSCFSEVWLRVANVRNTNTITVAALVITPAERTLPSWIASAVDRPGS